MKSIKQIREEILASGDPFLLNMAKELDDRQLLLLTVLVNKKRQIELLEEKERLVKRQIELLEEKERLENKKRQLDKFVKDIELLEEGD